MSKAKLLTKVISAAMSVVLAVGLMPAPAFAEAGDALATNDSYLQSANPATQSTSDIPLATGVWGTCEWEITSAGTLIVYPGTGSAPNRYNSWEESGYWGSHSSIIKRVVFKSQNGKKVIAPTDCSFLLYGLENMTSIDLSGLDTSDTRNMSCMFEFCSKLKSIDLRPLSTSKVTDMSGMFSLCNSLDSLDLSSINTSKVTSMRGMFNYCTSLKHLDVSPMNTSRVEDMSGMFSNCSSLSSLDLSKIDTSHVVDMGRMFVGCSSLSAIGLSNLNTSRVTDMEYMFAGCRLASVDLRNFDTSAVTSMTGMFHNCPELKCVDISSFDSARLEYDFEGSEVFDDCDALSRISVGPKTRFSSFPTNSSNNGGVWYSLSTKRWYSPSNIVQTRNGIADTYISNRDVAYAQVSLSKSSYVYDGKTKKPAVTVYMNGWKLIEGTDYSISYAGNKSAGTARVVVKGLNDYTGSLVKGFTIAKAKNTLKASGKTATAKAKKTKTLSRSSAIKVSKAKGKVTYKKLSGSKKISVSAKTGKVTVKKGLKKGRTYKVKVRVTAKGNANYKSGSKTVTVKVKVV